MDNRFFIFEDETMDKLDKFDIPKSWWSRPYEYKWASKFLKPDEIICDAGCGIEHPFKEYASKRVSKCVAVDNDISILELKSNENLEFVNINMSDIGKKYIGYFDKIFCISVLEHDLSNISNNLRSFEKAIKSNGKIILTCDFPTITPQCIIDMMPSLNLKLVGESDFKEPDRILKGYYGSLSCFCMVLEKIENNIEIKPIKPSETKPIKPTERK